MFETILSSIFSAGTFNQMLRSATPREALLTAASSWMPRNVTYSVISARMTASFSPTPAVNTMASTPPMAAA